MSYEHNVQQVQVEIRPAREDDSAAVCGLIRQLGYDRDPAGMKRTINEWEAEPNSVAYVAEVQNDLQGIIAVHVNPYFERQGYWGRVVALSVADHARRLGIGSGLLQAGEDFAHKAGSVSMELTSANTPQRGAAHIFYRRHGYTALATGETVLYRKHFPR